MFQFICQFAKENGAPPAYSDISSHFGFKSDGTVRTYLEHFEKKGYIRRLGRARGIQILKYLEPQSIPILGKIAAGSPTLATEDYSGTLQDVEEIQTAPGRYALKVKGDSMKNAGILNGDLAIIQTGVTVANGQIAAVMTDGSATLKRVFFDKDNVRLQPENESYKAIVLDRKNFETVVLGKYIALIRKV